MSMTANETIVRSGPGTTDKVIDNPATGTDLPAHRGLWVGGGGDLAVTLKDGSQVTVAGIAAGTLLPLSVKQIRSGTTATKVVLWV